MHFDNIIELEYFITNNYDVEKIELDEDDESVLIQWIIVDKDCRRNGIGSEVIQIISDYADYNNKTVQVELPGSTNIQVSDEDVLINFYSKNGFEQVSNKCLFKTIFTYNFN